MKHQIKILLISICVLGLGLSKAPPEKRILKLILILKNGIKRIKILLCIVLEEYDAKKHLLI